MRRVQSVPIVGPLFQFPLKDHRRAVIKTFYLWLFSFLPILFAAGMSKFVEGGGNLPAQYLGALSEEFIAQSQFVYAATFIPPLVVIMYDRYSEIEGTASEKLQKSFRMIFKGYPFVSVCGILVLLLTAATFGAKQSDPNNADDPLLYLFTYENSIYFYLFALYVWYLSILDGVRSGPGDFVDATREGEQAILKELRHRLGEKEGDQ